MSSSRHEGGSDVLTSPDDLYTALGVRLRERPGARWMVEMHPETRAEFDLEDFNIRFGFQDVRLNESRYVAPGEYHLLQWGFDLRGDGIEANAPATSRWLDATKSHMPSVGAPRPPGIKNYPGGRACLAVRC